MRDRFGTVLTVVVLFCAVASAPPVVAQDEGKTLFWVENSTVEIGKVIAGRPASATFLFHNDGPEDVHIIRAKPS